MEQSAVDTAPGLPDRLTVTLFTFFSYVGGDQPRNLFVSAGRQEGDRAVTLSRRRRAGDDFERRLFRSTVPNHSTERLSIVENEHTTPVYRSRLLSTDTQASPYCETCKCRTFRWPGKQQSFQSA